MNPTHPKLQDNIRSLIILANKIDNDSYDGDWCATNKASALESPGCLVHHMLWSPINTNKVLRQYASALKKNFNLTKNSEIELSDLFYNRVFIDITDFYFGKGMAEYFKYPDADINDVVTHLENVLAQLSADVTDPKTVDGAESVDNDTVTIQRGRVTLIVDANDPKVKELLAYLADKLV